MPNELSSSSSLPTKPYLGHEITLQPNWTFSVIGPEFEETNKRYAIQFKSLEDARAEIDKRISDTQKLRLKNIKLDLKLLSDRGEIVEVTKIDRREGNISAGSDLYPNVPWVSEALKRLNVLRNETNTIEDSLRKIKISHRRGYGRIDADDYPRKVEELILEAKTQTDKAREMQRLKIEEAQTQQGQNSLAEGA